MAKVKFKIEWNLRQKAEYRKAESDLIKEGWKKTNYTEPKELLDTDFRKLYTTWFEREW